MDREEKIMKRVQEHYAYVFSKGYEIVFIALQGSQNYELDVYDEDYMSDIDTKAVILPSFEDIVFNREPISTTLVLENNEHIDIKDIRTMFDTYKKQNTNFIETLFTDFKIINPKYKDLIQPIFDNNELIAHININQALRCMAGMSMEKLKALQHPYPTIIDKIEKFGYDPKQLHHIVRMNDFIIKYAEGKSYRECLIPDDKEFLLNIKKGTLPVNVAVRLAEITDFATKSIKERYIKEQDEINQEGINILNQVKYNILKAKFKVDIENEQKV